jgi:hypothetical protein
MVGMSVLSIDLSDNTDSGFYAAGNDYTVVAYPDETIDGVSVAEVVARFSIENRFTNVTQINGDATAAANAEAFFDGTGYAGTNNVIPTVTTLTGHTAQTADHTAAIADIPTVSEFNARTLASADYTVVGDLGTVQTGDSFAYLGTNLGLQGANATEAGGTGDHLTAIDLPNQTMDITGNITGNLSGTVGSVTGNVGGIAGTITTLDGLNTAQDTQHSTTQGKVDTAQADLDILTGSDGVVLATTQANYAPSKAGDEMDLVDAPNATAITAFATALEAAILNEGDATALLAAIAAKVEEFLVNEGDATATLAAISTAVWSETNRTLTANTNFNDPTVAAIADAVLDEVMSGHVTVGTLGKAIADILADSNELQSDNIPGLIAALNNISTAQVNSEVDSALADYDAPTRIELTTDTNSILTRLGTPAGVDIAADIAENNTVVDGIQTDLSNATDGLGALKTLIDNVQTAVDGLNDYDGTDTSGVTTLLSRLTALRAGYIDALNGHIAQTADHTASVAAILADTNELQGDIANGGRIDLILDELTTQGDTNEAKIDTIDSNVDTLLTRITSTLFSGITSLAEWLGLLAGKQAGDATALTEIAATGAGSGTFDEATDSLEAIRDRGDAEWTTGSGGGGGGSAPTAAEIRIEMDDNSTQLAAILADTNELQTDDIPGLIAALNNPSATAIRDAILDRVLSGNHDSAGTTGKILQDVLADTNELQSDDVPGLVAALNDISIAQVNAELDTALSDYDPPTRAELTTDTNSVLSILGTPAGLNVSADIAANQTDLNTIISDLANSTDGLGALKTLIDAVQAAVDGQNDLSSADIATALATYDGPTKAEMDAALTALNDLSAAEVNAEVVDVVRTDTATELSAVPGASPDLHSMIQFLYMALRNKVDVTSSAKEIHDDAGVVLATKSLSDDGTTYSEAKSS